MLPYIGCLIMNAEQSRYEDFIREVCVLYWGSKPFSSSNANLACYAVPDRRVTVKNT